MPIPVTVPIPPAIIAEVRRLHSIVHTSGLVAVESRLPGGVAYIRAQVGPRGRFELTVIMPRPLPTAHRIDSYPVEWCEIETRQPITVDVSVRL